MIRFVDLNTGNIFSGESPYIFWFPNQQSTNLWYSQPICFISEKYEVKVLLDNDDIFKLVDPSKISQTNIQYNIKDITNNSYVSKGVKSEESVYVHMLYVLCNSKNPGEFIQEILIDGEVFVVGADFYAATESLYINLSNKGIEIPNDIQRAMYPTNVLEDNDDNILLNRKWKELLSNYWDVIACKGSYKSLINSLKWFEYGDLLRLSELWDKGQGDYLMRDLSDIMSDKYRETLREFSKTTYLSISCALNKISKGENGKVLYDSERNPLLENTVFKWSKNDLALKLSLLGNFYETYFLPIHMNLIHSTIENVVYTNTIKDISFGLHERNDYVYDYEDIICNVSDGDKFLYDQVMCFSSKDALFNPIGVVRDTSAEGLKEEEKADLLEDMLRSIYRSTGSIIDFQMEFPLNDQDEIYRELLIVEHSNSKKTEVIESHLILGKSLEFSLLCKEIGGYTFSFQFDTMQGRHFAKTIKIDVIDEIKPNIILYKIKPIENLESREISMVDGGNDLPGATGMRLQPLQEQFEKTTQYLPVSNNGIKLNHMLIYSEQWLKGISEGYTEYIRNHGDGKTPSYIYINKKFEESCVGYSTVNLIRDSFIYIPEFYKKEELGGDEIEDYTIKPDEVLLAVPSINYIKDLGENYEWEFINDSTGESIKINKQNSVNSPYIAHSTPSLLSPGYYSIKFRYDFNEETKETKEIILNSAFKVDSI